MPYDDQGNYVDEGGMGPHFAVMPEPQPMSRVEEPVSPPPPPMLINSDFAVDTGGGAPNPNLAVTPELAAYAAANPDLQTEAARTVGTGQFATPADYYAWHQQTFGNEGRGGVPGLAVRTSTGAVDTTPINNNASSSLSVYDPSQGQQYDEYGSPIYTGPASGAASSFAVPENYGNPKNKIYQLSAAPDEKVRLVGLDGTVYYSGQGTEGAKTVADLVQKLGKEYNTGATWIIQKQAPGANGWQQVSQDTVGKTKTTALNAFANVVLPTIGAIVGGPWGAAAASALNSALQTKPLDTAIKDAALSFATAYIGGKVFPGGNPNGMIGAHMATTAAAKAATSAAMAEAGSEAAKTALTMGLTGTARDTFIQQAVNNVISGVTVTATKAGANTGLNLAGRTLLNAAPNLFGESGGNLNRGGPNGDTLESIEVNPRPPAPPLPLLALPALPFLLPNGTPALAPDGTPLNDEYGDFSGAPPNTPPPPPPGPLTKVADWIKAHPGTAAQLGVTGLKTLKSVIDGGSGGSGGSGSGGGAGFKTIDQQRAGLPDIFRAQLGAPRGMFSALGTAGTPYTPRPIRNLLPDPVVNTNGSGGANPSGTAALSDYLRRYPDVAAEAKANPGAYGDVNDDGVIDDNDFALMHYMLHGEADGRTMNVKTGGYIQHPSRDTDMHNSRFQVMRKAAGGAVDQRPYTLGPTDIPIYDAPAPTTAASMTGPLKQPVANLPTSSFAVDPRALAESYRSGTVAPPSVMQPRQSPYSGYEPGTMGGMYHYGEAPTGETQHYNYALAQGSVAPWMASTPTGTGRYNMFGVLMNDGVGTGVGGRGTPGTTTGGTPGTTTGGTPGTTTTNTPTPISDAERAKWTAYVNAYPDLVKAFEENSAAYKDFNNDGKVDIADFGLGQYTNYGKAEGRSLTGPAATGTTAPISAADMAKYAAYVNAYPDLVRAFAENSAAYKDFNNDGKIDIADFGLGQYTNYGQKEGRSLTGPAATTGTTTTDTTAVPLPGETAAQARQRIIDKARNDAMMAEYFRQQRLGLDTPGSGYQVYGQPDPSVASFTEYLTNNKDVARAAQDPVTGMAAVGDANHDGKVTPEDFAQWHYLNYGENEGRAYDNQYKKGGAATRSQFAVRGPGTGRSDSIPAALSDGEYVMDAETVALLGDGSSKAGAKKLDAMRGNLRKHKGRSLAQGRFSVNAKAPEAYLSGGRT